MNKFLKDVVFILCDERDREAFLNYNDSAIMVEHEHGEFGIRNFRDAEFFFGKENVDRIVSKLNFTRELVESEESI